MFDPHLCVREIQTVAAGTLPASATIPIYIPVSDPLYAPRHVSL
jgi:hypothetical protein